MKEIESFSSNDLKKIDPSWHELFDTIQDWNKSDTFVFKTSGSTGKPKPISFSKKAIQASSDITANTFNVKENDRVLLPLPIEYVAGKMMLYRAIYRGWSLHVVPSISDPTVHMHGDYAFAAFVPLQMGKMVLNNPQKLSTIKSIIIGGAPISLALRRKLRSIKSKLYLTYGMTETLTHIATQNLSDSSTDNYFEVLKGFDIAVTESNQLIIKAPHIQEDPIITNDIIEVIDLRSFRLKGRVDRVINSGGIKIQAEEVEAKINEFLDKPFYLYPVNDEILGEKVTLIIEGEKLDKTTLSLLQNCLNENLNKYEVPKEIYFKQKFERTVSGKIIRKR